MSGPTVVIGYILLIPSILGVIFSAVLFLGVFAYPGDKSSSVINEPPQTFEEGFDNGFRRSCANKFEQSYQQSAGLPAPPLVMEQYCECALSTFKETKSATTSAQECSQRLVNGSLGAVDQVTQDFYSKSIGNSGPLMSQQEIRPDSDATTNLFRIMGGGFAIFWGIAFFCGGLLGWLLTMKKRVLQCSACGATVSAS